ncbi:hypothetical protein N7495_000054 [Penicillium taxi]|uniref:uncharacterized protein n=1 Tax=Penicillium taxi TaxID=168475 RepID=UPI002545A4DD|nr:uncharacterized protein N7495_000054 [Penicillium taxi]KAJ5907372.1 hypothetical protein N7495_000054 [Penicillium taxi]
MGFDLNHVLSSTRKAFPLSLESDTRTMLNLLLANAHEIATALPDPGRQLVFGTEGVWSFRPVKLKRVGERKKVVMLNGRSDYHLWYGSQADAAVNVVVVEAKAPGLAQFSIAQALGYMGKYSQDLHYDSWKSNFKLFEGIVHRKRKDEGKKDTKVYGMCSDGEYWFFLKINDKVEWSQKLVIVRNEDYAEVIRILVYFLSQAAHMSPGHSLQSSHAKQSSGDSVLSQASRFPLESIDNILEDQ